MIQVLVRALRVGGGSSASLVLQEAGGSRVLQVHIGAPEAALIGYAIQLNVATQIKQFHYCAV